MDTKKAHQQVNSSQWHLGMDHYFFEGRGGGSASLILGKKGKNYKGKKNRQGKQNTPPPTSPSVQGLYPPLEYTKIQQGCEEISG